MTSKPKGKAGRPARTLSEKELRQVSELAGRGFTMKEIATFKGMSFDTFHKLAKEHYDRGKMDAQNYVISRLFDLIKYGDKTSIIFYLKTQCGWTETQRIETDVNVQHVISAKPLEDNDWAKKWTGKTIDITEEEDDGQED
jgi:3-hydroxyacyl-CoA dehydrogenase